MDEQIGWGVFFILYTIPFWIWQASVDNTLTIRRALYPGRPDEDDAESRGHYIAGAWIVGLCAAIWAQQEGASVVAFVVLGVAVLGALATLVALVRRGRMLRVPAFRYWLAASAVWILGALVWCVLFAEDLDFSGIQFATLLFGPPAVGAVGIMAFRWARQSQ